MLSYLNVSLTSIKFSRGKKLEFLVEFRRHQPKNTDLSFMMMFDDNIVIDIGNRSVISTSKIMKITAMKKNRDEKGSRAEIFWDKPAFEW